MKIFVYETESIAYENCCVGISIVVAENREAADRVMLRDCGWLADQKHLENVFKVEEKPLTGDSMIFDGKVYERLDAHNYE